MSNCRYELAYKPLREDLDARAKESSWVDGVIAVGVSGAVFAATVYVVWCCLSPVLHRLLP
jgi:hypothetical protein